MSFTTISFLFFIKLTFSMEGEKQLNNEIEKMKSPAIYGRLEQEIKRIKDSGIEKKASRLNQYIPNFYIGKKSIREFYKEKPVILKFSHAIWCPYCFKDLLILEKNFDRLKDKATVIAFAPEPSHVIESALKRYKLSFPVISDEQSKIAEKFKLDFLIDLEIFQKLTGYREAKTRNSGLVKTALPATFIIGTNGRVLYEFIDADILERVPIKEVIKALESIEKK